jgi:lipoprotein NlpI
MRGFLLFLSLTGTVFAGGTVDDSVDELLKRAEETLSRGQPEAALALADKAVAGNPNSTRPYLVRAGIYQALASHAKAVADYTKVLTLDPKAAVVYNWRGSAYFKLGQIDKSIEDFDRFLELRPAEKPRHWQRGISLYYAGRYEEGQKQFEGYEAVDANDVENAVWRYLCMAPRVGPAKARAAILKVGTDRRVPMVEVYALFSGRAQPADVLAAAQADNPLPALLNRQLFYAHLYLGLYYESAGDATRALTHLTQAVDHRIGHYMWDVARVHRDRLGKKQGR